MGLVGFIKPIASATLTENGFCFTNSSYCSLVTNLPFISNVSTLVGLVSGVLTVLSFLIPCCAHTSRLVFSNCLAYASAPGRPNWSVVCLAGPFGFVSAASPGFLSTLLLFFLASDSSSVAFLLSFLALTSFSVATAEFCFSSISFLLESLNDFRCSASSLLMPPNIFGNTDNTLSITSPIIIPNFSK